WRRIAGEPWPLRRRGFSPLYGSYHHRDLQQRTVHSTSRPSFHPTAAPAYRHGCDSVTLGIGAWLSPVYFRRPQPRPVSCYALLGGWLLLSLPSSCLGLRTAFYFYTYPGLCGLNPSLGCSPPCHGPYAHGPSPSISSADGFAV